MQEKINDFCITKSKYGYQFEYNGLNIIITSDELTNEIVDYSKKVVDFYCNNTNNVHCHILKKFKEDEWYVNDYMDADIIEKLGMPTIYVSDVDWAEITYLNSLLDNHIISVEIYGFKLTYVTVNG